MTNQLTVRVIYPTANGQIILRRSLDWNENVAATNVSQDGTISEFHLASNQPFLYFKPCLLDSNGLNWSLGNNYLAILNGSVKDIYPRFFSEAGSRISDIINFPSTILQKDCRIRIYHPPGYDENYLKRYPILYMHDGSNLFFPNEAFMHREWQIDETLDLLDRMNVIDKVVVIAVYAEDRMNDYTQPGYYNYGRFLVEELKPEVDRALRILPGPQNSAVMGSSLGGVVSFFLAWNWPNVFGKAACLSSTFNFRDNLLDRVTMEAKPPIEIYLDSGWPGDNYEVTRSMRDLLVRRGYEAGRDLLYFAFPNAEHDESYWATRTHIPFQFFFGKSPIFPS